MREKINSWGTTNDVLEKKWKEMKLLSTSEYQMKKKKYNITTKTKAA